MRGAATVRALYGALILVAAKGLTRKATGKESRVAATVTRVLGVRHLLQALTLGRTRSRGLLAVGMAIDLLHGLSMLALAAFSSTCRRATLLDATVAGTWVVSGWRAIRRV
ncbi:hypothetical protein BRC86_08840 [Halobacteriales archaeon QS_3_64_16]|nr:MAG: hypothetical protein BRC86_08840 [Halobacteriales archaeon QS_3_64_16]